MVVSRYVVQLGLVSSLSSSLMSHVMNRSRRGIQESSSDIAEVVAYAFSGSLSHEEAMELRETKRSLVLAFVRLFTSPRDFGVSGKLAALGVCFC